MEVLCTMARVQVVSHNDYDSVDTPSLPIVPKEHLTCKKWLGAGGFGSVYKAHHLHWDEVAIKVLNKGTSMRSDDMKSLRREVDRMLKVSRHDYIVQIRGIIPKTDCDPYCSIVMEFMEHGSLNSLQKRLKTFPYAVKMRMIYQVSLGMNFLHTLDKPIIHCDLKLENIFVNEDLIAKVGDFGLATWCTASNKENAGTVTHIPPETFKNPNQIATTKYDVYSFGMTVWQFTSGKIPYESAKGNSLLIGYWVTNDRKPGEIPDDVPDVIKRLIEETWQQDPAERPEFQVIKDRIREEYAKNYKNRFDSERQEILNQLSALPTKQEGSSVDGSSVNEIARFPWESADTTDSQKVPVAESQQDQNANPRPLQSIDRHVSVMPVDAPYVQESHSAQEVGSLPEMSQLEKEMAGLTVERPSDEKPVTDQDIDNISEYIGKKYKKLGRKLGVEEHVLDNIESDYRFDGQQELAVKVMMEWKNRNVQSVVTKSTLKSALVDIGLQNVADMLRE